ncbi:MAG TPA: hypothetical protein VME18_02285 [Acidobacteriaceae bacterium]|nr:hypothetical protein [Acidobacteriaceae bacterium]
MRRVLPVAMLSALLAVAPGILAQHGGSVGHAGGFHGGFAGRAGYGGFHGGFSAPRLFGQFGGRAPRVYGMVPRGASMAPQYRMSPGAMSVYRPAYGAGRATYGGRRRIWGHRGDYYTSGSGYGYGGYPYGFVNSWELLPWDLNDSDFSGDDTDASPSQTAPEAPQEAEEPEYVPAPDNGYREDYSPAGYEGAPPPSAPIAPEPQLTLIFKDGHTQQIRNYVLTQDALLDMDQAASGRMLRIPLSSLNLPATEKAAQQAGLEFAPPAS